MRSHYSATKIPHPQNMLRSIGFQFKKPEHIRRGSFYLVYLIPEAQYGYPPWSSVHHSSLIKAADNLTKKEIKATSIVFAQMTAISGPQTPTKSILWTPLWHGQEPSPVSRSCEEDLESRYIPWEHSTLYRKPPRLLVPLAIGQNVGGPTQIGKKNVVIFADEALEFRLKNTRP